MKAELFPGFSVSRETIQHLEEFSALTTKWTTAINLVSASSLPEFWSRHILDSAQIYQHAPQNSGHWVDIGTGGGFPGVVVAIIGKERSPQTSFTFVESDQRKSVFLKTVCRELSLNADVTTQRIEAVAPLGADVLSARALAPLSTLLGYSHRHLRSGGVSLFLKGQKFADEIAKASKIWSFQLEEFVSITDPASRLLSVQRIDSRAT